MRVLNTEEKLDAQSQQWIDDISEYADIKELDEEITDGLKITFVENMNEVLERALA